MIWTSEDVRVWESQDLPNVSLSLAVVLSVAINPQPDVLLSLLTRREMPILITVLPPHGDVTTDARSNVS